VKPERRKYLRAGAAAALALQMAWLRRALAAGSVEKGVHRLRGDVRINGVPAQEGMDVKPGDVVTTGAASEVVFVTGKDAFLVRANSRVEAQGILGALVLSGLRLVTGALLSVFTPGERKTLRTATATIGIRGTAVYLEAEETRTYICTCYGEAEIESTVDPSARETVRTQHHEQPRYVMGTGAPQMLMGAPVLNHTDAELTMLESLAGRKPPFLDMPGYRPGRY
jgi:ribosomal 50S subunit-recycling heat shock protein